MRKHKKEKIDIKERHWEKNRERNRTTEKENFRNEKKRHEVKGLKTKRKAQNTTPTEEGNGRERERVIGGLP